jgi:NAD(P)-dependent dehydrogenase (short-subunit alcohol dehydrogenase family)
VFRLLRRQVLIALRGRDRRRCHRNVSSAWSTTFQFVVASDRSTRLRASIRLNVSVVNDHSAITPGKRRARNVHPDFEVILDSQSVHQGKVALITGGSRGIGFSIAQELIKGGARVMITGRREDVLEAAASKLGEHCRWRACPVDDEKKAKECVDATLQTFGRLDVLVNNAGINPQWGPMVTVDARLARKFADANIWAPLMWISLAFDAWMKEHGGAVLNITSVGGELPTPNIGYYNTTKAALGFMTRQLAAELAPMIRVNAIAPGLVETDMMAAIPEDERRALLAEIPMGRFGKPEEIAVAAAFLVSEHAAWLTGQVIAIDGGALVTTGLPKTSHERN